MKKLISASLFALFCLGFSLSAYALETGQCLPATQVRTAIAAEGQNPIIIGERSGYGYPTALIFTSNTSGSKGYLLRGDWPLGKQADIICIDSVYRDIRLNDISKPGIPAWARMDVDASTAIAICARDKLGYQELCLPHDKALFNISAGGLHVMFQAIGTVINPRNKSMRSEQRILAAVRLSDYTGIIDAVTSEGANYMLAAYTKVSYTQHGEALLNTR